MIINELHIHHLRNIASARLFFNSRFNFIYGPNGSGKTSLLESIYLLGSGHSFRSRDISSILSHGQPCLTVFGRTTENDTISIQKSLSKPTLVKLNNQFCSSSSKLAYNLPIQVFYQDIFQIIDAGPTVRRSLIDWGLFHVKPSYFTLLTDYKRILKQRNALLKSKADKQQFQIWDEQLSLLAEQLDQERSAYFSIWKERFSSVLAQLTDVECEISYYKGWDKKGQGLPLTQILSQHLLRDQQRMYTQDGAHQADIIIEVLDHKAKNTLSRGQQKIILIALKLSQASLLNKPCLFLFDDISAELDNLHLRQLLDHLSQYDNQMFFTSTDILRPAAECFSSGITEIFVESGTFRLNDENEVAVQ